MSTAPDTQKMPHESLCNNCGKCCYKKIIVGRTVFITPFPCEFLNTQTNLCTIYDRRHELNPLCLSIEQGMKVSAFPEDCPYVPEMAPKNYRPARENWSWNGEWSDFDGLADDLDVAAETREKVRARGPDAPPMHAEVFAQIQQRRQEQLLWGASSATVVNAAAHGESAEKPPSLADLAAGREGRRP